MNSTGESKCYVRMRCGVVVCTEFVHGTFPVRPAWLRSSCAVNDWSLSPGLAGCYGAIIGLLGEPSVKGCFRLAVRFFRVVAWCSFRQGHHPVHHGDAEGSQGGHTAGGSARRGEVMGRSAKPKRSYCAYMRHFCFSGRALTRLTLGVLPTTHGRKHILFCEDECCLKTSRRSRIPYRYVRIKRHDLRGRGCRTGG